MDQETKLKLLRQIIVISSAFCILVAFLLVFNFWQIKSHKPLESKSIEALVQRLADDPKNEELREEIRDFDLLARKAYFTSEWQIKTGTYLLLFGGIVLAIALKMKTDIEATIALPENAPENPLKNRIISHRWLLISGVTVFALALLSSYLTKDFLKNYHPGLLSDAPAGEKSEEIQLISIVDSSAVLEADTAKTDTSKNNPKEVSTPAASQAAKKTTAADFKNNESSFRGYLGQGISYHKNIPTDWDGASGKNIKWKVAVSKPGYNSPVIWGDKIFIAGGDKVSRLVSCYDRNTGRLLWEREADNIPGSPAAPPKVTDDTGLSAPTMAIDGTNVYAIFATGDIIAFDLDGNRVWAKNLGVPVNHYGHSSSLIYWKGKVIVQYDTSKGGRMLALDSGTGNTVWDIARTNKISWSSPMLLELNGKMQIITTADPSVAAYDPETGKELWKADVLSGEVAPSAATWNGLVFATNEYAKTVALDAAKNGALVWQSDEYLSEVSSPVAYNGLLFLATSYGVLVCYDAQSGENIWEKQFDKGFYSSPMIAENKVYIIDMDGIMHILKADKSGTIVSEPKLGEPGFALPVFAEGRIYIRGKNSLFCIGR